MIDPRLRGRVAVVTGGNCGIGAAIARGLTAEGAAVAIPYLRLAPDPAADPALPRAYRLERARSGEEVASAIRAAGGRASAFEIDLAQDGAARAVFERAESELGPVEILVHNASSWLADTFVPEQQDAFGRAHEPVSTDSHDRPFAVDARAGAALIAEYARRHRARGSTFGRVVAMTSGGRHGFPGEVSYGAAKAALESYVMSAAHELGRFGVTANVVHPPATDTGWLTPEAGRAIAAASPLRHVGQPDEVAEVVVYLASWQARFVTGNVVRMH